MQEAFGESMTDYMRLQSRAPMSAAIRDVKTVLKSSDANSFLTAWREEDALSNAGAKPLISTTGALALLLVHMRLGRIPQVRIITQTFHELNHRQRFELGLDHAVDHQKSYDRIWAALQRLILLIDEYYVPDGAPRARYKILTAAEYGRLVEMRDPERCARNRERMQTLANALIEGTIRGILPTELYERWEGNNAGDATKLPLQGQAGNPNVADLTKDRRSINCDAGYYIRYGDHAGYTADDATHLRGKGRKVKGSSPRELDWAIEVEVTRMTPNVTEARGRFPLLTTALGFHIPGAITGSAAKMVDSLHQRGHPINYTIFDRAYPGGYVRDFHHPIRMLGGKLVFDYDITEFGVRIHDEERGFVQIMGSWYLDNLPEKLREIDKPMVELRNKAKRPLSELARAKQRVALARGVLSRREERGLTRAAVASARELSEATTELNELQNKHRALIRELDRASLTYEKQLEQREQYRLLPKGRMAPDGSRRYLVPDTSKVLLAKPQRFTGKTVTIEADIMADKNPGGLKHEQHLVYGTPLWRKVYGMRNGVESVNRNLKRAQFDDLANPDRRHVRGNTFTYAIATSSAVMENIRKILNFLKECLAIRPHTSKNADLASTFWEPEPRNEEVFTPDRR